MPVAVLARADWGQVPQERVPGGHPPARVQQSGQRDGWRHLVEPGCLERRGYLCGGPLGDRLNESFPGREVGVDGLPGDPGGPGDVLDAGRGIGVQGFRSGPQDRGDALLGVGPLPPAPGCRGRRPARAPRLR